MIELLATTGDAFARMTETPRGWSVSLSLVGTGAQCLAPDPRHSETIYVGSRGGGVHRTTDAGGTWEDTPLPHGDVFSVAVSEVDAAVYAGCEPSMLFRSRDGGSTWEELESLRTIPSAPTWSFPPRPWTSHVRWIAPSPHQADVLLVGIELGGVMLTVDGGETWLDHRPGAQRDAHALAWHPRARGHAYEAGGGGAAWSDDGGVTWRAADAGRDRHYVWGLAVDPHDPTCWYVSASPGPGQAHRVGFAQARIYRWREDGPWQALAGGLPDPVSAMPYALVAVDSAVYAGLADGTLYASRDAGDTWERLVLEGDPLERVVALAAVQKSV